MIYITLEEIERLRDALIDDDKAPATVDKYLRELAGLARFLQGQAPAKHLLLAYRESLRATHSARTINAKLSAINAWLGFAGLPELRVKLLRTQRNAFIEERRELSGNEYKRLLAAAQDRNNLRLYHVMLTICSTGIRVGELRYITLEAARAGRAEITLKGKTRVVLLPRELRGRLLRYAARCGIPGGPVFRTRSGKPLDRSNICHDMKRLCAQARVDAHKVFPHNLRHLFARSFYAVDKNLAHLADVLGHSSVETTRMYVAASARVHERTLQRMRLII